MDATDADAGAVTEEQGRYVVANANKPLPVAEPLTCATLQLDGMPRRQPDRRWQASPIFCTLVLLQKRAWS